MRRTAIHVGAGPVKGLQDVRSIWVTTHHGGIDVGTEVTIQIGNGTVGGYCIYVDPRSDLAILAGTVVPSLSAERVIFSNSLTQGWLAGVLGFPKGSDPQQGTATLTTAFVAHMSAGSQGWMPPEAAEWSTHRFFLLDKSMDCGMSGGPVVDGTGCVIGMLVASGGVNSLVSCAVRATYCTSPTLCPLLWMIGLVEWRYIT